MLDSFYPQIRLLHVGCVALSGSIFLSRGLLRLGDLPAAQHPVLRIGSQLIDTILLAAAIVLTTIIHQYPFVNAWLTVKVLLLAAYIGLGTVALRRGRSRRVRATAFVAALMVFGSILAVARQHQA